MMSKAIHQHSRRALAAGALAVLALFGARTAPAQAAVAFPGQGFLPDNRAWELVSPPQKNGGDVLSNSPRTRAATDGSAVAFASLAGFADVRGFGASTEYMAQRSTNPDPGNNGWSTHAITPPQESSSFLTGAAGIESHYTGALSPDLQRGIFFAASSPLTDEPNVAEAANLYLREDLRSPGMSSYQLLSPCPLCTSPIDAFGKGFPPTFAGASADYRHVAFQASVPLAPGASGIGNKVYEWDEGTLRLAGVLPDGSGAPFSAAGQGVGKNSPTIRYANHPISSDGSRVNFMVAGEAEVGPGDVYQRIQGRTTVKLNVSERAVPDTAKPATYWAASADASRVFFSSEEALTEDTPVYPEPKLYMWKRAAGDERQSLSVNASGGSFTLIFNGRATEPIPFDASPEEVQMALDELTGAGPLFEPIFAPGNVSVSGSPGSYEIAFAGDFAGVDVPQMKADASTLSGPGAAATVATTEAVENLTYMNVDHEPADDEANPVEGVIGASEDGRYVYFATKGQLVAGAPILDFDWGLYLWHDGDVAFVGRLEAGPIDASSMLEGSLLSSRQKQSAVSADGHHLLFNASYGKGLLSLRGGVDYDHGPGACSKDGFLYCQELYLYDADADTLQCASCNPTGAPATVSAATRIRTRSGGAAVDSYQSHILSEDGRYAFFTTAEKLVGGDANGVEDAYLYDSLTGKPRLLSSGESPFPSYFMESSADGRDAFFLTRERLSGWDFDDASDLYDARIGGGFPEPSPPPPSCQGDACQPAPRDLNDPTPASSNFVGAGNETRPPKMRCGKGQRQVKARGKKSRCVKRKTGQGKKHSKRDANSKRRAGR